MPRSSADDASARRDCRPREASGASKPRACRAASRSCGRNSARSTPLRNTLDPLGGDPELDQPLLQPAGNRDQAVGLLRRPADPAARDRVPGDQIEIAAPGGDHDRAAERPSEQHGGDAVGVEIMRIDQVELAPLRSCRRNNGRIAAKARAAPRSSRSWAAPDSADDRRAARAGSPRVGMRAKRHSGRTAPEANGNHGQGATTRALTAAAFDQLPQARLDKNPVLGLQRARI